MHLTTEHRKRLEEKESLNGVGIDIISKAKLNEITMPVILKGEEEEDHVYDLEPLIDYFVCQVRKHGKASIPHPSPSVKIELKISDIEALTGDGINEDNEIEVKKVLVDFEADIQQFLSKIPHFSEEQVNAAAKEVGTPGEEWIRKSGESKTDILAIHFKEANEFLIYAKSNYDMNFKVGDSIALLKIITKSFSDENDDNIKIKKANIILEQLEALFDDNMDINAISDYNHDERKREYILNPDSDEVLRIQQREIAAENLLVMLTS